jgi:hypothetical protein
VEKDSFYFRTGACFVLFFIYSAVIWQKKVLLETIDVRRFRRKTLQSPIELD